MSGSISRIVLSLALMLVAYLGLLWIGVPDLLAALLGFSIGNVFHLWLRKKHSFV